MDYGTSRHKGRISTLNFLFFFYISKRCVGSLSCFCFYIYQCPPFKHTLNLVTLRKDSWHKILFSVEDHTKKADHVIFNHAVRVLYVDVS